MEYRFSKSRAEIIKALSVKLTSESMLLVWQKKPDGSRQIIEKMTFYALYADEGVFTLKMTRKECAKINPKKYVYFLLEGHDFVFKTKMAVDQKEYITLQIPHEVRLEELRVHPRTYFSPEEKKSVEVVFIVKNADTEISLTCPLVNLSDGGACIVISKETISNININADVILKFTADIKKAVIRNARVFAKKNLNTDELYAIGVQFQ
jgi:hypothetical protein